MLMATASEKMRVMSSARLLACLLLMPMASASPPLQENCTGYPDIASVPPDLVVPPLTLGPARPGMRVRATLAPWAGTHVYHALYLPPDWTLDGPRLPVFVDFPGNGPFADDQGDRSPGTVDGLELGYGATGGTGFIWLTLPFLTTTMGAATADQTWWWGCHMVSPPQGRCAPGDVYDIGPTLNYTIAAVAEVVTHYNGDPGAVVLGGFSRGALATYYVGLHDATIAGLWAGFVPYAHLDGVLPWPYPASDRASALTRLHRLRGRPSFIVGECDLATVVERDYILSTNVTAPFVFVSTGFRNHNDTWTMRPGPARDRLRSWLAQFQRRLS